MSRFFQTSFAFLLCAALGSASTSAHADTKNDPPYDARRDRLEGLDKADLARLDPYLARGPVALVEFADSDADALPAINIAVRVHAPAPVLERIVTQPAGYPRFMPALDAVNIVDKHGNAIVYDWSFDLALLQMSGRNVMTIYPSSPARPGAGLRVTIDSEQGDLGRGRYLLRVLPVSEHDSVLVLSMRLDLRQANYVARQLAKAARAVNRSANLALAFSMALHFRAEAEARAGVHATAAARATDIARPTFDLKALAPLLDRGDLIVLDASGGRLDQLSVLAAVDAKQKRVHSAVRDARSFGEALVPGGSAQVVSETGNVTLFDWDIDLPLVGVSGRMRMDDSDPLVSIDATQGAMRGGKWRFELAPLGKHATLITGWARFDFANSTWLLEKLIKADPYLGHGISAASEVMLVRALRSRATE
ncbi:MAG TPA: hypothetical protein VHM19_09020 [Polyangiales bacterium]|nr:hypothetical protein [Polyangiales bacterium]